MKKPLSLYIHIPFCTRKCTYCSFFSKPGKLLQVPAYFQSLKHELASYNNKTTDYTINTIYIGGGTPSLVEATYISDLVKTVFANFDVSSSAEITIETNPESVSNENLREYHKAGINRISIGLQTSCDRLLKYLGRAYTRSDFLRSYNLIKQAGFTNINVDVIFGIPSQTMKEWEETLALVTGLSVPHLACYSLELDNTSLLGKQFSRGELEPLEEEHDRKMYHLARNYLTEFGYHHYEVSNFAKPGNECRHNSNFWQYLPYIGIGAGAYSFFEGKRYSTICSIEAYSNWEMKRKTIQHEYKEDGKNINIEEVLLLHLRLLDGVNYAKFEQRYGIDLKQKYRKQILELKKEELIEPSQIVFRLTEKGMDLINQVLCMLVA